MADLAKIVEDLNSLTLLEASELAKMLQEKWGVSAAAPVATAAAVPGAAGTTDGAEEEEQIEFDVVLQGAGDKKIQVIKAVRELTPLGLKEAKELVDSAPATILQAVRKEAANEAKDKLEAAGGTVEIK